MTTVQIDTHDPLNTDWRDEILHLLREQPGRPEKWGETLIASFSEAVRGRYGAYIRATDGETVLGAALMLSRQLPGEREARPEIVALWVEPTVRSQGLGRKLANVAQRLASERGAEEIVTSLNPEDDANMFMFERWGYFRERVLVSRALD